MTRLVGAGVLATVVLPAALLAQTIIVEAHSAGNNNDVYSERSGSWQDARQKSRARGLSPLAMSRQLTDPAGGAVVTFSPRLESAGRYEIEITWPDAANAAGLTFDVPGQPPVNLTMSPTDSDNWRAVGSYELPAGPIELKMTIPAGVAAADPSQPVSVIVDGIRVRYLRDAAASSTTVGSNPFESAGSGANPGGIPGVRDAGGGDNPFVGSSQVPPSSGDNPFAAAPGAGAPADSGTRTTGGSGDLFDSNAEFSTAGGIDILSGPDGGGAAPAPAPAGVNNPFASANTAANPFDTAPASSSPADPFDSTPAVASNPFDNAPANTSSPFESAPPASSNPFDSAPAGAPGGGDNPFGASDDFGAYEGGGLDVTTSGAGGGSSTGFGAPPPSTGQPAAASPFGDTAAATTASGGGAFSGSDNPFASTPSGRPAASSGSTGTPGAVLPGTGSDATRPFDTASANFGSSNRESTPALFNSGGGTAVEAPKAAVAASPIKWEGTLEEALAKAKSTDKPILLVFFGEDKLTEDFEDKVLSDAEVTSEFGAYLPVELDFALDNAIAKKYNVPKAPYAVVLNKFGFTKGHVTVVHDAKRFARELKRLKS